MVPAFRDEARSWRIFYTRSRAEKRVEERLEAGEVQVFLPRCAETRQWKDRKKRVILPLFPGYIFAKVDERERIHVLQVDGVVSNVTMGGRPCTLSDHEIEQLRILQQDPYRVHAVPIAELPEVGSHVTINRGVCSGLNGEVRGHRGQTHVVVVLPAIKQAVRIIVPAEWVGECQASDYLSLGAYHS